jgi:hypothetical protein
MLLDGIRDEVCPSFMNGGDGGHVLNKLLVRGMGFNNFSAKRDWGENREQADCNILLSTLPYCICEELRREGNFRTNLGRDLVEVLDCIRRSYVSSINLNENRFTLLVVQIANYGRERAIGGNDWNRLVEHDEFKVLVDPNKGSNLGRLG